MPSLNFTVFVDKVIDGRKPHTIRALRLRPFKIGDDLSFFTGMRKSTCRRLRSNTVCTAAVEITIDGPGRVFLCKGSRFYPEGKLTEDQELALAKRDGFESVEQFHRFFGNGKVRFVGQLIEWIP